MPEVTNRNVEKNDCYSNNFEKCVFACENDFYVYNLDKRSISNTVTINCDLDGKIKFIPLCVYKGFVLYIKLFFNLKKNSFKINKTFI